MKKLVLIAALAAACMSAAAQDKFTPAKGNFSVGVTFNPVTAAKNAQFQPGTGEFAGEYLNALGDNPKQMYFLAKDPLAALSLKYQMTDHWAVRAQLGINGSNVSYNEFVQDDAAVKANPNSTNQVIDIVHSSMNMFALGAGMEYSRMFGMFRFITGFGLQYAVASGSLDFQYGNAITSDNKVPSTSSLTTLVPGASSLNDGVGMTGVPGFVWSRPKERANVGVNTGIGLTCDMGVEFFFAGRMSLSAVMTFTPIMLYYQGETYSVYEGWSTVSNKLIDFNDRISPGSSAFLYGTESFGFRLAFNYYL